MEGISAKIGKVTGDAQKVLMVNGSHEVMVLITKCILTSWERMETFRVSYEYIVRPFKKGPNFEAVTDAHVSNAFSPSTFQLPEAQ